MKISNHAHLAYCTNVHRGNSWAETFDSLEKYVMEVRRKVAPNDRFAIGLRLGAEAARELSDNDKISHFADGLIKMMPMYLQSMAFPTVIFMVPGLKNRYTARIGHSPKTGLHPPSFTILEQLLEPGEEGSVSTLPGSFKEFLPNHDIPEVMIKNLDACSLKIEELSVPKNLDLHLGMEPEPLGMFETTPETITFFDHLFEKASNEEIARKRIGVNYDCCHLAVEFEDAHEGLDSLVTHGIRLSKLHLSSALTAKPTEKNLQRLRDFIEPVYLHQVALGKEGKCVWGFKDLDLALQSQKTGNLPDADEWRIHFHVPLHASPGGDLGDTRIHVIDTLFWLSKNPDACRHLEMETYTWEVMPKELQAGTVIEQVARISVDA